MTTIRFIMLNLVLLIAVFVGVKTINTTINNKLPEALIKVKRQRPNNLDVVQVTSLSGWSGTGWFTQLKNGDVIMVTAAHVCATEPVLYSMKGAHKVLARDKFRDVCFLSAYDGLKPLTISKTSPRVGETVVKYGFPGDTSPYQVDIKVGLIQSLILFVMDVDIGDPSECLEAGGKIDEGYTSCTIGHTGMLAEIDINPGDSGGPVLNTRGQVIGLSSASGMDHKRGILIPNLEILEAMRNAGFIAK